MLYYLFRFLEQWGISGSHMWGYISFRALLALSFIIGNLCLVRREIHQVSQEQANYRDTARCQHRPVWCQEDWRSFYGWCHHHPGYPRTGTVTRTFAQHLSDSDDHHHRMAPAFSVEWTTSSRYSSATRRD